MTECEANSSLGQLWKPLLGFHKPHPNLIACVTISAKQWNADNPDVPVTQRMLLGVLWEFFSIKPVLSNAEGADSARQEPALSLSKGLARLRPEDALKLAGWIARGELAGQRRADEPKSR